MRHKTYDGSGMAWPPGKKSSVSDSRIMVAVAAVTQFAAVASSVVRRSGQGLGPWGGEGQGAMATMRSIDQYAAIAPMA
jgi:hypothetical protein